MGVKKKNTWDDTNERKTYIVETFVHDKKVTSYKYRGNIRVHPVTLQEYVVVIIIILVYIYIYIYVSSIDRTKNVEHVLLCTKKKKTVLRRGGGGGGGGL